MKTKVVKFGGTSLANAMQFKKVANIINSDKSRKYVVASAPGKRTPDDIKVTDLLYKCYEYATEGMDWHPTLQIIQNRFQNIVDELEISYNIEEEINIIESTLLKKPERDYLASRGEYLNSKIMAKYLGFSFVDACNLVFFSKDGLLDEEKTNQAMSSCLIDIPYAVIPGFYGSDDNGNIRTFSRGGSDITGSLISKAVQADIYENWTDVSGMLFTDPKIVYKPQTIDYITYRELRELSYMGASVLHEDAVFPVRKAGIPINIRNTNQPDDEGTMIVSQLPENRKNRIVTGIAGKKGFCSIQLEKSMMNAEVGFGACLLEIFAKNNVPFEHCPTGIDTMSVVVNSDLFLKHKEDIIDEIKASLQPESIIIEDNLAMIAVVGQGMVSSRGVAARTFRAVADCGVNIRMIDQGSSELNIIIGVDESDFDQAIRGIYKEFS